MVTSLSHKLSIDGNASHGAWVRDLGTGQEFLDFSGDWAGWALGHGLRGYSWADFVDELLSHRERKLHFQWEADQALIVLFVMPQWAGYRSFHKALKLILPQLSLRKVFI